LYIQKRKERPQNEAVFAHIVYAIGMRCHTLNIVVKEWIEREISVKYYRLLPMK